jgi:hypothetical protein
VVTDSETWFVPLPLSPVLSLQAETNTAAPNTVQITAFMILPSRFIVFVPRLVRLPGCY